MTHKPNFYMDHADCLSALKQCGEASVNAIITDPPYFLLKDRIENGFSEEHLAHFFHHCYRCLSKDSFMAFFGQLPSLPLFFAHANAAGFTYKEHIVWVKRSPSNPMCKMTRRHESILIFAKGKPKYCDTKTPYSDLKEQEVMMGVSSAKVLSARIRELEYIIHLAIENPDKLRRHLLIKKQQPSAKNSYLHRGFKNRHSHLKSTFDTSIEGAPVSNIWCFGRDKNRVAHPTVKPIAMMRRLVALLSQPGDIVFDPFTGSGSTGVAALQTGRQFKGFEILEEYYHLSQERLLAVTKEKQCALV